MTEPVQPFTMIESLQILAMRARSNLEWLETEGRSIPGNGALIPRLQFEVMALESQIKSVGQKILSAASFEGEALLRHADLIERIAVQSACADFWRQHRDFWDSLIGGSCEGHPMPQPGEDNT